MNQRLRAENIYKLKLEWAANLIKALKLFCILLALQEKGSADKMDENGIMTRFKEFKTKTISEVSKVNH